MPRLPHLVCATLFLGIVVMHPGAVAQDKGAAKADVTVTLLGSGGGPNPNPRRFGPAEEADVVFARVKPRLAVYAHISDADLITPARKSYPGPLEAGEDLMTIEIGDKVIVRRINK